MVLRSEMKKEHYGMLKFTSGGNKEEHRIVNRGYLKGKIIKAVSQF
jgi:hypothetical protein